MTKKLFLVLALLAALALSFGEFGDDIWTVSPYAACADDGNPILIAPNLALRASLEPCIRSGAATTFVAGAPPAEQVRWSAVLARALPVRAPAPPPRRC